MRFADRAHAGLLLARALAEYDGRDDVVVLGLPRGGVPVGRVVADTIRAPLDVFTVRKLGLPGHPELAVGAIASGGVTVVNDDVARGHGVSADVVAQLVSAESEELTRRDRAYRGDRARPSLIDRTVLLVDDGLATGATMRAAAVAVRQLGAREVVCAVPVAPPSAPRILRDVVDRVVAVAFPDWFGAVGQFYDDFRATTDNEVRAALEPSADG